MITDFLIAAGFNICQWLIGLVNGAFGTDTMTWKSNGGFTWLVTQAAGISSWVPFPVITACIASVTGVWLTCLIIKTVRAAVAHIPLVGGAG